MPSIIFFSPSSDSDLAKLDKLRKMLNRCPHSARQRIALRDSINALIGSQNANVQQQARQLLNRLEECACIVTYRQDE